MEKPTTYFYRILIEKIAEKTLKSQNKWKLFLGKEASEEEWEMYTLFSLKQHYALFVMVLLEKLNIFFGSVNMLKTFESV